MIVTDEYGDEEVKRGAANINEWEISWEALIDREDIQDVMKGESHHPDPGHITQRDALTDPNTHRYHQAGQLSR
jgi:hypothetical protein